MDVSEFRTLYQFLNRERYRILLRCGQEFHNVTIAIDMQPRNQPDFSLVFVTVYLERDLSQDWWVDIRDIVAISRIDL